MADISAQLHKILEAIYGEEVRGSIHDALAAMNVESNAAMEFAATAKDSAMNSAAAAKASEENAAQSESAAKESEANSKVSETQAAESAATAASMADAASASASAAQISQNNALASEQAARSSETSAANAASTATEKAASASASAEAAKVSEDKAAASENAAKVSEQNASASESAAKVSEEKARLSEANAAASASTASEKAEEALNSAVAASESEAKALASEQAAKTSETNAAGSAATATEKAQSAADSANAAKTSQDSAAVSAQEADASKTSAAASEAAAIEKAELAAQSASAAQTSEENAASFAADSLSSKNVAAEYAQAAQTAKEHAAASETAAKASETSAASSAVSAKESETNASEAEVSIAEQINEFKKFLDAAGKNSIFFGVCDSEADTAEKSVTIESFALGPGAVLVILFTKPNTADGISLKINDTAAKPVVLDMGSEADVLKWDVGKAFVFVYAVAYDSWFLTGASSDNSDCVPITRTVNGKPLSEDVSLKASDVGALPADTKGRPDGVAQLDADGKVPSAQLPDMDYDAAGSAAAVQQNLTAHTNDRNNPHRVTAAQAGAVPASEKGKANGVAQLDASGKVPTTQLPTLGGHTAQKTAPANTKLLWIDTSDGNILKFYNAATEAWEPVGAVWWR